jgi:hypothetical protein
MNAPGCALSIVRARGRRPAKPVRPDRVVSGYDLARTLDLHHRDLVGPADLHRLRHRLLPRPDCGVVPGIVADPARTRGVRRLLHADGGDAPPLAGAARRRIALDLDGLPLPVGVDHRDLACCARVGVESLPAPFHRAALIVHPVPTASGGDRDLRAAAPAFSAAAPADPCGEAAR